MTARALSQDAEGHDGERRDPEGLDAALGVVNEDQTLGRYELLTPIGRGGMAMVWAARLRGTRDFSTVVAVKTMLPALSADPRFETMFLAEAEIASRIKHPNVCAILDLGEDRDVLYLVMEWIDGEPLSTILALARSQGRTIPYRVAASITASAARGLHAAHEPLGIVHRDVSPQNILVDYEGHVKIVDFGVAKAAQRTDHVTQSGFIKGKVAYLAPEQVQSPTIDGRADIFALGTVLYEMTTGTHPFRGATELDTLLRIASPDPPPLILDSEYPEPLRAIVVRALAKDPSKRYETMHELASDLEAWAASAGDPDPQRREAATDSVVSFVADVIGERRQERALALREATRAADERAERRRRRDAAGGVRSEESSELERPSRHGEAGKGASRRSTTGFVVAVGLAGIALGGLAVWASLATSRADASAPASASAALVAATVTSASPVAAEPVAVSAAVPMTSAPREASPRTNTRAPVPASKAAERPAVPAVSVEASSRPKARFRQPDF